MKGIVKLIPITNPAERMKVIVEDYHIRTLCTIHSDLGCMVGMVWYDKTELHQLVVEYKDNGNKCILGIPPDDWKRNLNNIGKEVEFVRWDGGRQVIGEPDFQPVACIQEKTVNVSVNTSSSENRKALFPSSTRATESFLDSNREVLYTEEEVRKFMVDFGKWGLNTNEFTCTMSIGKSMENTVLDFIHEKDPFKNKKK